jgi:DNA-binding PadR family transcriptional regulator
MYYVLLALVEECSGTDVMSRVEQISAGRIKVGPGTVYAMLDKFLQHKAIQLVSWEGRRKSYAITEYGRELLDAEFARVQILYMDGKEVLRGLAGA